MRSASTERLDELDEEIVFSAASGSVRELERVARALRHPAHALALRMLGNHDDAEDASQEAIIRVITRLSSYRGESKFSTWAWTVMTRAVLDHMKRSQRRGPSNLEEFEEDLAQGAELGASVNELDPEERALLWQVKIGCARAMLQCLDLDARAAYVLGEVLELDAPTCARVLEISPATFRKRLSRARKTLYATLARMCGVASPGRGSCRCVRRLEPARRLGRLDERDRGDDTRSVEELAEYVRGLHELQRPPAFFRADPLESAPETLLERVMEACVG